MSPIHKTVQAIGLPKSGKKARWAVLASDGIWYSSFDGKHGDVIEGLAEGDVVAIDSFEKGGFHNLTSIGKVSGGGGVAPPQERIQSPRTQEVEPTTKTRSILEQVSMKVASWLVQAMAQSYGGFKNREELMREFWATKVELEKDLFNTYTKLNDNEEGMDEIPFAPQVNK